MAPWAVDQHNFHVVALQFLESAKCHSADSAESTDRNA
jgi:hypothetical protein